MAAADLTAWRKQNSDPMTVDMVMTDSSTMRAIVMIPKGKTLKDCFNVTDTFLEVECLERGTIVFQREALRSVRQCALPAADQMDKRVKAAEKLGAHTVLQIPKSAPADSISAAHDRLRDVYDPARAAAAGMPPEVIEFMAAMCRRFEAAQMELTGMLAEAPSAQKPAA
jgi:hypothetical protein